MMDPDSKAQDENTNYSKSRSSSQSNTDNAMGQMDTENEGEVEPLLTDNQIKQVFNNQNAFLEWVREQVDLRLMTSSKTQSDDTKPKANEVEDYSANISDAGGEEYYDNTAPDGLAPSSKSTVSRDTLLSGLQAANEKIKMLESKLETTTSELQNLVENNNDLKATTTSELQKLKATNENLQMQITTSIQEHTPVSSNEGRTPAPVVTSLVPFRNLNSNPKTLDLDTFSLMMITDPLSTSWYLGLLSFAFQTILGAMIAWDQISEGSDSSTFNIPFKVDFVVHVGQFLTIILGVSTQSDVLTAIRSFILLRRGSDWKDTIGIERSDESNDHHSTGSSWFVRIALPNGLKLLQGFLVIFISFVIIVQSDNIIDLLKDFTALMVLSEIDNVLFYLAGLGYLGQTLKDKANEVKDIEIKQQRAQDTSSPDVEGQGGNDDPIISSRHSGCKADFIQSSGLFLLFAVFLAAWINIIIKQDNGTYFRTRYPNCTKEGDVSQKEMFRLARDHFGDGTCYGGPLNTLGCKFEGGDCVDFNLAFPLCKGDDKVNVQEKLENGFCDEDMSVPECDFDGYQCCSASILDDIRYGDGQCNGGKISSKICEHDGGDCSTFLQDFSSCPMDAISKNAGIEDISDIVLGNGVCEGSAYSSELCGFEYGDCDVGQVGQDVIFRGVYDIDFGSLWYLTRMSADGSKLMIGMPFTNAHDKFDNPPIEPASGKVKIFGYSSETKIWNSRGEDLIGEKPGDLFGHAIAMNRDGSQVVVGSYRANNYAGKVQVYRYNLLQNDWVQVGQVLEGVSYDRTGYTVDMTEDGSKLAMSSPVYNGPNQVYDTGKIEVFELKPSGQLWEKIGQEIHGENEYDLIGRYTLKLNASGSRVYFSVGNLNEELVLRAHQYNASINAWIQVGFDIPNPDPREYYAQPAISADGNRVAVSSYITSDSRHGEVRIYDLNTSTVNATWEQLGTTIVSEEKRDGDGFGFSIDMSADGSWLVIASVDPKCLGRPEFCPSGSVRLYKYDEKNPPHRPYSRLPLKYVGDFGNPMEEAERQTDGNIFGYDISLSGDGSKISVSGYDYDEEDYAFVKVYEVEELFYINCLVEDVDTIGDGECTQWEPYYTEKCGYDGGDCELPSPVEGYPNCYIRNPGEIGSGHCSEYLPYNSFECGYDGGACPEPVQVPGYPECFVSNPDSIGDGGCDDGLPYNSFECGFDGGDCLPDEFKPL